MQLTLDAIEQLVKGDARYADLTESQKTKRNPRFGFVYQRIVNSLRYPSKLQKKIDEEKEKRAALKEEDSE